MFLILAHIQAGNRLQKINHISQANLIMWKMMYRFNEITV